MAYTSLNDKDYLLNVRSNSENLLEKDKSSIATIAKHKRIVYSDSRLTPITISTQYPNAINCIGQSDKDIYNTLREHKKQNLLKILEDYDYNKNYYETNMYTYSDLDIAVVERLINEGRVIRYSETELNDKYSTIIEYPVYKNEENKIILKFNKVCESGDGNNNIFIAPIIATFLTDINILYIALPRFKKIYMGTDDYDILMFNHVLTWVKEYIGIEVDDFDIEQCFDNIEEKIDNKDPLYKNYELILARLYNDEGNYISLNGAYNKFDPGLPIIKDIKKIISDENLLNLDSNKIEIETDIEKSLYERVMNTKRELEEYIERFKNLSVFLTKGIKDTKNNKTFVLTLRTFRDYNYNYIRLYDGNYDKESIENVIRFLYANRTVD